MSPTNPTRARPPSRLSPKELLGHAYNVLEDPLPVFASRWPRAVALLGRQALEASLEELWAKRDVKIGWAAERAQLLCLKEVLGNDDVASGATLAWNGLSEACHQHPYDLPPTAAELAGWLGAVDELRRTIDKVPARVG